MRLESERNVSCQVPGERLSLLLAYEGMLSHPLSMLRYGAATNGPLPGPPCLAHGYWTMFQPDTARWFLLCLVTLLGCTGPGATDTAQPPQADMDPSTGMAPDQQPAPPLPVVDADRAAPPQASLADQPVAASADRAVDEAASQPGEQAADDGETETGGPPAATTAALPSSEPEDPAPSQAPSAPPSTKEAADGPRMRVVARDGTGDHTTIAAAMRAAGYLDEIRIQPGTYNEALVIDRRVSLRRGAGLGPVIINGGERPALTLDRVTMIEVSDLVLKGGAEAMAAVVVNKGQLRLTACRLDASPKSAAAGTSGPGAQLILADCIIRAGEGTALAMTGDSKGALESCRFSWGRGNPMPFIDPEAMAVVTVRDCVFGQKPIDGPFLVSKNLLSLLPDDGAPTLFVQPDRSLWPHWASLHETHFESLSVAADRAPTGSHLRIAPGTYAERVGIVRSLTLSSTGGSEEVVLKGNDRSALWINTAGNVTLRGLSLTSSASKGTPAVQINGGHVNLINCHIANDQGHGVIVTDNHAESQVSLAGCRLFSAKKAVYATGGNTHITLSDCLLAGDSIALFLMDGATSEVTNSTFDTERYAVELWGPSTSARLEGCTILRASQVLAFKEGAVRSQVQTAGLIVK